MNRARSMLFVPSLLAATSGVSIGTYDTYCPGASRVMGQTMTLALAHTDYRVSD